MKTADIYLVNLDPTVGDEIKKMRAVVVLNPGHQKHLKLAVVVPVAGVEVSLLVSDFSRVSTPSSR